MALHRSVCLKLIFCPVTNIVDLFEYEHLSFLHKKVVSEQEVSLFYETCVMELCLS